MEQVAIVGVGQTKHEKRKKGETFDTMVYEVTCKALEEAGITIREIDNVVTVSNDFWDGRTISSMAIQDACGSYNKNISTVEGDGTFGVFYGALRILSEDFRTTLVVSHMKGSEGQMNLITNAMFDPIYERNLGLDVITSSALQARAYMDKYGITEEQCAKVSVKNHKNAKNNPYAHLAMDLSVEQVMKSRMLATPIKLLDSSPISDGAAAVILASEKRASTITDKPVWIKGIAHCADAHHLGDRDLAECAALAEASRKTYEMASIKDPAKEIDAAEVYDAFSYQELMWYELLGFCGRGEGGRLIDEKVTEPNGDLPVNPSGGCLSAHPVFVAGMVRVIEATLQVRGDAGAHQIPGVKTALAHGINGPCGQSHCVIVLGRN